MFKNKRKKCFSCENMLTDDSYSVNIKTNEEYVIVKICPECAKLLDTIIEKSEKF